MANDIAKSISANDIKNGTLLVQTKVTGPTNNDKSNEYVSNKPTLADIQSKYDARFDDPSYYFGCNT